jgi:alpha-methylacyl-CoA racemase
MSGPLAGIRVVELAGIGPTPHAAMLLADGGCRRHPPGPSDSRR